PVARLQIDGDQLARLVATAGTDGDDLAFHRLLLGGVRDDDAAGRLAFLLDTTHHNPIMQRAELHCSTSVISLCLLNELAFCQEAARVLLALLGGECHACNRKAWTSQAGSEGSVKAGRQCACDEAGSSLDTGLLSY